MTVIYVPRLIESAEQAEALPVGSVLIRHRDDETTRVATRIHRGPSPDHVWRAGDGFHRHEGVVGMQALVPIEAEEVIGTELRHQITDKSYDIHVMRSMDMDNARWQVEHNPKSATGRIMRQYRTPWEEA